MPYSEWLELTQEEQYRFYVSAVCNCPILDEDEEKNEGRGGGGE